MSPEQFDVAFCLQAINYWFCDETVGMVERVLRPGGLFVFNTFNVKPPETPVVKQYDMDGDSFVEVSWSVGDIVQHVQIRSGMEPHFNSFRWVSPDEFHATLGKYFSRVNEKVNGPSSLYVCHKVLDLSIIK